MLSLGQKLLATVALGLLALPMALFLPWWLSLLGLLVMVPFTVALFTKL
jgi:hypothetical protein